MFCSITVASVEGFIVATALPSDSLCWTEAIPTQCVSANVAMVFLPRTSEETRHFCVMCVQVMDYYYNFFLHSKYKINNVYYIVMYNSFI